jgi:hypothetical protein
VTLAFVSPEAGMLSVWAKLAHGAPLTPEDEQQLVQYEQEVGRRELIGLVDLAAVMEEGGTEPAMLFPELLVRGEHHTYFGTRESLKTWLLLWIVAHVIATETVVWIDKEMGRKNLADRLLALGVTPEVVRERFVYLEFPTLDCSTESRAVWRMVLDDVQPALVCVDAYTEVLADADLNENSGTDIEKWAKAYITPARRLGITTVMIDHTGHSDDGRPVASRQKGAAAKVELSVRKRGKIDRETIGPVEVRCTKNTVAAPIPATQTFRAGGDGAGHFVCDRAAAPAAVDGRLTKAEGEVRKRVYGELRKLTDGQRVSQNKLHQAVGGGKGPFTDALRKLADDPLEPLQRAYDAQRRGGTWEIWYDESALSEVARAALR